MKNLICIFMIVFTVTIWLKYDKNLEARKSIVGIEKVSTKDNGVFYCFDESCGKSGNGWDGYVPFNSMIFIELDKSDKADAEKFKKESLYD